MEPFLTIEVLSITNQIVKIKLHTTLGDFRGNYELTDVRDDTFYLREGDTLSLEANIEVQDDSSMD